jgi:arginine decarboxylase
VADHSFYIYKIDVVKKNWYVINGSLMNMTPDMWGIEQDFTILPVNLINNQCIPVCLGGETCDPDDRYFLNNENVKLFLPVINEGEDLYIAIFAIGAYQEIISGIGGVHHCMIPEGNELIIYKNKEDELCYYKANDKQTAKEMLEILDYNRDYLSRLN